MDEKIKEEVVFDIIHCVRPQLIIRKFSIFYIKKTFIITAEVIITVQVIFMQ